MKIKRIYDGFDESDGYRVLVDRLWPRGISKENAKVDEWLKDIAPSTELRKWFNHDPDLFVDFKNKYLEELQAKPDLLLHLKNVSKARNVTLVYGAKDEKHNQAVVLMEFLSK